MNKTWEYYDINNEEINRLTKEFGINTLIATILINRGIINNEDIKKYLKPTRNDFYDPYLLNDMEIAVDRVIRAIDNKEEVIIYGDYDVDGITSITVLKKFLDSRGIQTKCYVPKRLEEGYGLNKNAIKEIASSNCKLMITVDCGISAIEEIEYANSLNLETIVTDHHEQLDDLPNALAVINPKRLDSNYPFSNLAGVGVVFKFIQAISKKLKLPDEEYLKYIDLVSIGTISDIVPLIDENRVIAKLGLKLLQQTRNIGLKVLLDASRYKTIDSTAISYGIGPRINACGRMGYETEAIELFLTEDIEKAKEITNDLNRYNKERQAIEKQIYEEAIEQLKQEDINNNIIVLSSDNWHHGVIGIVSSKITEMYYKPTILISFDKDEGKGSGRSIAGFDLHETLCKLSTYLDKYGGHEMAIGLSINKKNYNVFKEEIQRIALEKNLSELQPIIKIDKQLTLKELNLEIVRSLQILEPFGESNKIPLFAFKNLRITSIRALSEGKHLKLTLKEDNNIIEALGFNLGSLSEEYQIGDKVDIVGNVEVNEFNNEEKIQINIKDIRKSL